MIVLRAQVGLELIDQRIGLFFGDEVSAVGDGFAEGVRGEGLPSLDHVVARYQPVLSPEHLNRQRDRSANIEVLDVMYQISLGGPVVVEAASQRSGAREGLHIIGDRFPECVPLQCPSFEEEPEVLTVRTQGSAFGRSAGPLRMGPPQSRVKLCLRISMLRWSMSGG